MPANETPPSSPYNNGLLDGDGNPDAPGEEGIDAEDIVEVIDLDEVLGDPDEDLDEDEDGMEDQEDCEGPDGGDEEDEEGRRRSLVKSLPEDNSERQFEGHDKKSVFCLTCHPRDPDLVASGGEDDLAYIWKVSDTSVVHKQAGFKDSVTQIAFNHDGAYLAMADMCGVVKVLKLACKEVVWEFETSDIQWLGWHPGANVLFAATVDSELWMWKIPSGDSNLFAGHGEKAECAAILPDGKRALVGYGDGSLRLFDLKSGSVLSNFTGGNGHVASVASLAVRGDNNLMASGGVDGMAMLFNSQTGKNIGTFSCGNALDEAGPSNSEISSKSTVEAMLFTKAEVNYLVTGTLEGVITIWDLSTQASRQALRVGTGIVGLQWRNGHDTQLLVSTLDGTVRLVDIRSGKVLGDCSGHTDSILGFEQSCDGKKLISASDDGLCKVFEIENVLKGHIE